jgi:hypothetical protein
MQREGPRTLRFSTILRIKPNWKFYRFFRNAVIGPHDPLHTRFDAQRGVSDPGDWMHRLLGEITLKCIASVNAAISYNTDVKIVTHTISFRARCNESVEGPIQNVS